MSLYTKLKEDFGEGICLYETIIEKYETIIAKKLKGRQGEDSLDIVAEIHVATILENKGLNVSFEEEQSNTPSVDMLVKFNGTDIHVEVTRIRKTEENKRLKKFEQEIKDELKNTGTTLCIRIALEPQLIKLRNEKQYLLDTLESEKEPLLEFIKDKINHCNAISRNGEKSYSLKKINPVFDELEIRNRGYYSFTLGNKPAYGGEEYKKFTDKICEKRKQVVPNACNLFVFLTSSEDHEEIDLKEIMQDKLDDLIEGNNAEFFKGKGFENREEFIALYENISSFAITRFPSPSYPELLILDLIPNKRAVSKLPEDFVSMI